MNLPCLSILKWTNRSKNGHSGAFKTNRFQSGFHDLKKKNQTEQTVNRKKSGFRASRQRPGVISTLCINIASRSTAFKGNQCKKD